MPSIPGHIDLGTSEDWDRLNDAYGGASRTPRDLRRLWSDEAAEREAAKRTLYGTLYHQGGRFPATVKAAPMLLQMLEAPSCPERPFLLEYITNICFGFPHQHHPFGVNPMRHRAALQRQANAEPIAPNERAEPCCEPWSAMRLFDFFRAEQRGLHPFVVDADPAVRLAAVFTLAHLMADDPATRAMLARRIEVDVPVIRHSAMIGLSLMERAMGVDDRWPLLRTLLTRGDARDRFLAGMGVLTPEADETVVREIAEGMATWAPHADLPGTVHSTVRIWCNTWGDPRGQAALLIARLVPAPTTLWVEALGEAMPMPDVDGALDAVGALLRMVAPAGDGGFRDVSPDDLSPLQRRALQLVRDRGIWSLGGGGHVLNMQDLLARFGLPRTQNALADWLDGRQGGETGE